MYFFIFQLVFCFVCLTINVYYALITKEDTQTFIVQETMPNLHENYKENENVHMVNPFYTKYSFKKKSQII
jgi:ABC-type transport system involved in multi-copper enzyme maturation permease subunit